MIYAEKTFGGSQIGKLLVQQGMPEEDLPIFEEFMDMSKAADYSLLEKAKTGRIDIYDYSLSSKYDKAVNLEIARAKDNELTKRFLCFLWAAIGVSSYKMIDCFASSRDPESLRIIMQRALTDWLGRDKARLCAEAVACESAVLSREYEYLYEGRTIEEIRQIGEIMTPLEKYTGMIMLALAVDRSESFDDTVKSIADFAAKTEPNSTAGTRDDNNHILYLLLTEVGRFDKSARARAVHYAQHRPVGLMNTTLQYTCFRALDVIEEEPLLCTKDALKVLALAINYDGMENADIPARLKRIAARSTEEFTKAVLDTDNAIVMKTLADALKSQGLPCPDIGKAVREQVIDIIKKGFDEPARSEVTDYICGNKTLAEVLPAMAELKWATRERLDCSYYPSVGADDFFCRYYAVLEMADMGWSKDYIMSRATGFEFTDDPAASVDMLLRTGLHPTTVLKVLSEHIDTLFSHKEETSSKIAAAFGTGHKEELDKIAPAELSAIGRQMAAMAYSCDPERFKAQLFDMCEDTSKAVKAELVKCIAGMGIWHDDIAALLTRKKASARELALSIIEAQGAEGYKAELEALFAKEKSAKIKDKAALLLGAAPAANDESGEPSAVDPVEELTKGGKAKKVAFAFEGSVKAVHNTDGGECERKYLEALMMCYAGMSEFGVSPTANALAEKLDKRELAAFAADVFAKWLESGAQAKTKWVLYFAAIHGGSGLEEEFMHYIKYWGENSRGAIASEAVRAMALSGSTTALMNVDGMSRKFKNKMVRSAAAEALRNAAEELGLTTEELADRIVPDLGFDENMCREFDFGPRQFKVYLGAGGSLQIFNGDKQVKNLPKPGANDDAEKAEAAAADFKEMKKQLKTVAANQKARLESVLMNDRKWSVEGWEKLFVKNAVMHGFAIGLIWGLYDESGKLTETFRYTEEGSFNTADDDELTLPENGRIGLVHPLELTEEQIAQWTEQLEDYEIAQPFCQLARKVYRMTDDERRASAVMRFSGIGLNSLSLIGKLTKIGWYKGQAEDAGFFYYFYREDISRRTRREDGSYLSEGVLAELDFSGASIVNYDFEGEEVTVGKLGLYKPGADFYRDKPMRVGEVSDRYFSELVMQLTSVLGSLDDET